ncbi:unnamed protein product [Oikopleura dioica]|uniref:Uncharacterized protein n=1 Tax=Oikopleura dioica TaxID=34765 RepID=E4XVP9_OIKDI|nr:unnamed protein product [Oikopleura dioica]
MLKPKPSSAGMDSRIDSEGLKLSMLRQSLARVQNAATRRMSRRSTDLGSATKGLSVLEALPVRDKFGEF